MDKELVKKAMALLFNEIFPRMQRGGQITPKMAYECFELENNGELTRHNLRKLLDLLMFDAKAL